MSEAIWKKSFFYYYYFFLMLFLVLIIFQATVTRLYHSMFCGGGEEAVETLWTKGHPSQRNVVFALCTLIKMMIFISCRHFIFQNIFVQGLDYVLLESLDTHNKCCPTFQLSKIPNL